jgi:small subunit ribosomal protein S16
MGKKHLPFYRVVVVDSRAKRDGKVIEEIGKYHPTEDPSFIEIDSERAKYWLSVGAQPSETALSLMKLTGAWQAFKGEEYDETSLKIKAPKEDVSKKVESVLDESEKVKAAHSKKKASEIKEPQETQEEQGE